MNPLPGTILLVEDNDDDIFFMQRALKAAEIHNAIRVAKDGQSAMEYLAGSGDFSDRDRFPAPCFVLLDLKLPVRGGLEVLAWIREQSNLRTLVVMVLTTSKEPSDVQAAYQLGANCYIVKPNDVSRLIEMMRALKHFWLTFNEFPDAG